MPRPYPDSAKRENFCGGWDFQKAQPDLGPQSRKLQSAEVYVTTPISAVANQPKVQRVRSEAERKS